MKVIAFFVRKEKYMSRHFVKTNFPYKGYHNCDSHCKIEFWEKEGDYLFLLTELAENEGTSVTNRSEYIATLLVVGYHTSPQHCRFIEHYGEESYIGNPVHTTYAEVTYKWDGIVATSPDWQYMPEETFQMIVKEYE